MSTRSPANDVAGSATGPLENGPASAFGSAVLLLCGSLLLQFSFDRVIGSDGFFHIRQAANPLGPMPWMTHSIFADGWVDHQLLFHAFLAPFTLLGEGPAAAKAAAAVLAAAALYAIRGFVAARGAPAPLLFALLPAALCWRFLLRMEMPRTQSLSLVLLLVGVWALAERRHRLAFGIAWVYAWTYQVALLLFPIALLHALVHGGPDPRARRGPAWVAAGLTAGFVVHPHSPGTLNFLWEHVVLKVANQGALPVGTEWTAGGVDVLLSQGSGVVVLMVAAAVVCLKAATREALFHLLLAAGALVGAVLSIKFLEYAAPLASVALAIGLRDHPQLAAWLRRRRPFLIATVALLTLTAGGTLRAAVLATEPPPNRLAPALAALDEHATPGDIVYHFSWSDFPELVFHGPQYRYIVGLDPHFLALHDPELWALYAKIEAGWGKNPSKPIAERFGARWVVLVLPHRGAEALLDADQGLESLHRDDHAVVYEVLSK